MQRHDLPVTRRGDLTDEQWDRIYPYLPVGRKGRPFDSEDADMQDVSIDSSCCKAHQHSAGAEKGGLIHGLQNISE